MEAFKTAEEHGLGAVSLDGKMIDVASYLRAQELLEYVNILRKKESQ